MDQNRRESPLPLQLSPPPTFKEALRFWIHLGFISFGGPSGQIAILHTELVEKRRWITEDRFAAALNYCMILPGPEATQLAIYLGWLLHGTLGGLAAGIFFILPSAILLWALSWLYVVHGHLTPIIGLFHGLKAAVVALVAIALFRMVRRRLTGSISPFLALGAFIALFFFKAPFPLIIGIAALIGIGTVIGSGKSNRDFAEPKALPKPRLSTFIRTLLLGIVLWIAPVIAAGLFLGWGHTIVAEGFFFAKAALITFGGAYAVLPYVAQQAVFHYHWLAPGEMIDGLGLAESTPGPLIIVLQFIGFLGGWHSPGFLPPLLAATLASFLTTWITFTPSFIAIFTGAPYIEQVRENRLLSGALTSVTAAVVGVILNLAVWFAGGVLFPGGKIDLFAGAITLAALFLIGRWGWKSIGVLVLSAIAGVLGAVFF